ncbi:hypothetical protein HK102_014145 [Quaeritorhiza haematococci]|nr:hypothetical protein HK102_014145 [Quaeritorhiza haematococci]
MSSQPKAAVTTGKANNIIKYTTKSSSRPQLAGVKPSQNVSSTVIPKGLEKPPPKATQIPSHEIAMENIAPAAVPAPAEPLQRASAPGQKSSSNSAQKTQNLALANKKTPLRSGSGSTAPTSTGRRTQVSPVTAISKKTLDKRTPPLPPTSSKIQELLPTSSVGATSKPAARPTTSSTEPPSAASKAPKPVKSQTPTTATKPLSRSSLTSSGSSLSSSTTSRVNTKTDDTRIKTPQSVMRKHPVPHQQQSKAVTSLASSASSASSVRGQRQVANGRTSAGTGAALSSRVSTSGSASAVRKGSGSGQGHGLQKDRGISKGGAPSVLSSAKQKEAIESGHRESVGKEEKNAEVVRGPRDETTAESPSEAQNAASETSSSAEDLREGNDAEKEGESVPMELVQRFLGTIAAKQYTEALDLSKESSYTPLFNPTCASILKMMAYHAPMLPSFLSPLQPVLQYDPTNPLITEYMSVIAEKVSLDAKAAAEEEARRAALALAMEGDGEEEDEEDSEADAEALRELLDEDDEEDEGSSSESEWEMGDESEESDEDEEEEGGDEDEEGADEGVRGDRKLE